MACEGHVVAGRAAEKLLSCALGQPLVALDHCHRAGLGQGGRRGDPTCSAARGLLLDSGASGGSDLSPAGRGDLRGLCVRGKATALSNAQNHLCACF